MTSEEEEENDEDDGDIQREEEEAMEIEPVDAIGTDGPGMDAATSRSAGRKGIFDQEGLEGDPSADLTKGRSDGSAEPNQATSSSADIHTHRLAAKHVQAATAVLVAGHGDATNPDERSAEAALDEELNMITGPAGPFQGQMPEGGIITSHLNNAASPLTGHSSISNVAPTSLPIVDIPLSLDRTDGGSHPDLPDQGQLMVISGILVSDPVPLVESQLHTDARYRRFRLIGPASHIYPSQTIIDKALPYGSSLALSSYTFDPASGCRVLSTLPEVRDITLVRQWLESLLDKPFATPPPSDCSELLHPCTLNKIEPQHQLYLDVRFGSGAGLNELWQTHRTELLSMLIKAKRIKLQPFGIETPRRAGNESGTQPTTPGRELESDLAVEIEAELVRIKQEPFRRFSLSQRAGRLAFLKKPFELDDTALSLGCDMIRTFAYQHWTAPLSPTGPTAKMYQGASEQASYKGGRLVFRKALFAYTSTKDNDADIDVESLIDIATERWRDEESRLAAFHPSGKSSLPLSAYELVTGWFKRDGLPVAYSIEVGDDTLHLSGCYDRIAQRVLGAVLREQRRFGPDSGFNGTGISQSPCATVIVRVGRVQKVSLSL